MADTLDRPVVSTTRTSATGDRRVGIRDLILLRNTLELDNPAAPAVARSSILNSGAAEGPLASQRLRAAVRRASPEVRMQAFAELSAELSRYAVVSRLRMPSHTASPPGIVGHPLRR